MVLGHFGHKKYPDWVKNLDGFGEQRIYTDLPNLANSYNCKEIGKNESIGKKMGAFYSLALSGYWYTHSIYSQPIRISGLVY